MYRRLIYLSKIHRELKTHGPKTTCLHPVALQGLPCVLGLAEVSGPGPQGWPWGDPGALGDPANLWGWPGEVSPLIEA